MRSRRSAGFTLLEVLVALAIVAFGIVAAFNAIIQMAHSTARLQERAFGDWIALNQIAEIRLSGDFPDVSEFDGSVDFAGRPWRWQAKVSQTDVEDLRRIDMSVAFEDRPDDVVTIVTGFVSRRSGTPATTLDWWGRRDRNAPGGGDEGEEPDAGEERNPPDDTPPPQNDEPPDEDNEEDG